MNSNGLVFVIEARSVQSPVDGPHPSFHMTFQILGPLGAIILEIDTGWSVKEVIPPRPIKFEGRYPDGSRHKFDLQLANDIFVEMLSFNLGNLEQSLIGVYEDLFHRSAEKGDNMPEG